MTENLSAPSKINWFLAVGGVRPSDGRHELLSCFQILRNPCDKLVIDYDAAPGVAVKCDMPGVPQDADNLAGKAALLFAEKAGLQPSWRITLEKHIPVAAGMGGGSSDAGTVLRALNRRSNALSQKQLNALALSIGADVPLFVAQQDAIGRGAGEILTPVQPGLNFPPVLVVAPCFPVSARWAYQHFTENPERFAQAPQALEHFLEAVKAGEYSKACTFIRNDLALALWKKFPLLDLLCEQLLKAGALHVEVSGSGPTLFAIFADKEKRAEAKKKLSAFCAQAAGMQIIETEPFLP